MLISRHLADYLLYLDENDEEYWQYFWWRDWYEVADLREGTAVAMCSLCEQLNDDSAPPSSYPEMGWWWLVSDGDNSKHWWSSKEAHTQYQGERGSHETLLNKLMSSSWWM